MDYTDFFNEVREFHAKFDLPHHPITAPTLLAPDVFEFRMKFLREELEEFERWHKAGNLAECADALVDLAYVDLGTAHLMGLPFDLHWRLVHGKNMIKERALVNDIRSKRGHPFDVVKPLGWVPPDHRPLIEKAIRDHAYVFRSTDNPSDD